MSVKTNNIELIKLYKSSLDKVKLQIADMYQRYGSDVTYAQMMSYNRLTNLEIRIADILKNLGVSNIKTTTGMIKDVYRTSFNDTTSVIKKSVAIDTTFVGINEDAVKAVLKNDMTRIKWEDRVKVNVIDLNSQVKNLIAESLIAGESYSDVAKKLVKKFNVGINQAMKIARTEGHRAVSQATIDNYDSSEKVLDDLGYKHKRVWITGGSNIRDSHSALNGVSADKNNQWTFGSGAKTSGPGMSGIAEEDINCKCSTILEIIEK